MQSVKMDGECIRPKVIFASGFGKYSSVFHRLISKTKQKIPVVFIDHGYTTYNDRINILSLEKSYRLSLIEHDPRTDEKIRVYTNLMIQLKNSIELNKSKTTIVMEPLRRVLASMNARAVIFNQCYRIKTNST